jgi:hypothetical protein
LPGWAMPTKSAIAQKAYQRHSGGMVWIQIEVV